MIRSLFLNAFIALYSLLFSSWGILISLFDRGGGRVHRYCASPWASSILRVSGVRVKVGGLENLEAGRPHIFMCNHQSFFDIFVLLSRLPGDFKFILKKELMRIPVFGTAMKGARYIPIDRADPRKAVQSMNQAADKIRQGVSVLIFPEGTRSEDGRLQGFKAGGFHLALKSGCDIVPVVILNSNRVAPKGSLRIRRGSVSLHIGRPIAVGGYTKRTVHELMGRVRDSMVQMMGEA
ncbi:MAG: 1-acyl-sn-glycerol-3-phosphate acyltransferase, partial [Deltaproteobacteria bacterium]|nr:1-acyl-sn-glycerol-3-phosphate acyltransferase [Deltaproteobacteria bacterium]